MIRLCRFLFAALVVVLAALAVASLTPDASADGPIKVSYSVEPAKPEATRDSLVKFRVYDAGGKAIDNAKIVFAAEMKHDMSAPVLGTMKPIKQEAKSEGQPGEYAVRVVFDMPGTWEAKVEVDTPVGRWSESFPIEVDTQSSTTVNWPIILGAMAVLAAVIGVPAALKARRRGMEEEEPDDVQEQN